MQIALYDGTIDGLLCVITAALESGTVPEEIRTKDEFQGDLFAETTTFASDPRLAAETITRLRKRLGAEMTGDALFAFLSDEKDAERVILRFVLKGWREGPKARADMSDETVLHIRKIVRRVKFEAHRLTGLARFRELADGTLYAPLKPDNDVVILVARHFRERLASKRWVVHDTRRGKAAFWDGNTLTERTVESAPDLKSDAAPVSAEEKAWQELWKVFYKYTDIEERKNWRCRAQHMPQKYWEYLVELEK